MVRTEAWSRASASAVSLLLLMRLGEGWEIRVLVQEEGRMMVMLWSDGLGRREVLCGTRGWEGCSRRRRRMRHSGVVRRRRRRTIRMMMMGQRMRLRLGMRRTMMTLMMVREQG